MEIGNRVITNNFCDFPNISGIIVDTSIIKNSFIVKLDNGITIITMGYAIDLLN